jgi:hypothetical protein
VRNQAHCPGRAAAVDWPQQPDAERPRADHPASAERFAIAYRFAIVERFAITYRFAIVERFAITYRFAIVERFAIAERHAKHVRTYRIVRDAEHPVPGGSLRRAG